MELPEEFTLVAHTLVDSRVSLEADGPDVPVKCAKALFAWLVQLSLRPGDHVVILRPAP